MTDEFDSDQLIKRYIGAVAGFGEGVQGIADHEWDRSTPCGDWTVRDLVAHVVLGEAHFTSVLKGESTSAQTDFGSDLLGLTPMTTWRGTALLAIETVRAPGVAEADYAIDVGLVSGKQLLGNRITDNVVHTWDLGVALGRPEPISDNNAEWLLDFWQSVAPKLGTTDSYGPPVEPPPEATASTRLLALLGRTVSDH